MNIFVGNLSFRLEEQELAEAFEAYGEVESAKILTDRNTGRSKGIGFIEMPNDDEAMAAIEGLNDTDLAGRSIKVEQAKPRN